MTNSQESSLPSRRALREAMQREELSRMTSVAQDDQNALNTQNFAPVTARENATTAMPSRRELREKKEQLLAALQVSNQNHTEPAPQPEPVRNEQTSPVDITQIIDQLNMASAEETVVNTSRQIGTEYTPTAALFIEQYPTGEITGPIGETGEIILTNPEPPKLQPRIPTGVIPAGIIENEPGLPRRATEALTIIGTQSSFGKQKRNRSLGRSVGVGVAAFMGLVVLALVIVAYSTGMI